MALTPEHRQEEWYQQMINAATGKYLPSITAQDAGKVMTVESDGSWGVENIPSELPSVTSADETKVLTVDSNGDWVAGDAPSGLPSTTSASAGDVLSLNNDKEAVWTTPSSGGGVLVVNLTSDADTRTITLDKTWQEIKNADAVSILRNTDEDHRYCMYLACVYYNEIGGYGLDLTGFEQSPDDDDWVLYGIQLHADSASDYPSVTMA